jgi:alginate O-acetyltransferase complex protein AlgI
MLKIAVLAPTPNARVKTATAVKAGIPRSHIHLVYIHIALFWSNWTQLRFLENSLTAREIALTWLTIFLGSSVILALWEAAREWLLSFEFQNESALSSRYVRTVWDTALVVISMAVTTLLNTPPPDIVYKKF